MQVDYGVRVIGGFDLDIKSVSNCAFYNPQMWCSFEDKALLFSSLEKLSGLSIAFFPPGLFNLA